MFSNSVTMVKPTIIDATSTPKIAASPEVAAKQLTGRHTITLFAKDGTVYIGNENVSAESGLPLAVGEIFTVPVSRDRVDQIYVVGGTVVLTEWF